MAKRATKTAKPAIKAVSSKKPASALKSVKKAEPKEIKATKIPLSSVISTKRNLLLLGGLVIAIVAVILYQNKGLFVAATVNGKPVSRLAVISMLEKQAGKTTLDSLITEALILDEGQKMGKSISQEEVDEEVKRIEESVKDLGQPLDELLKLQGLTREQLVQQIKIQKLIEKLLADKITVKDDEVSAILAESTEELSASETAKLKTEVQANITQQKIAEVFPKWLEELKSRSNVRYFTKY